MSRRDGGDFHLEQLSVSRQVGRFTSLDSLPTVAHAVTTRNGFDIQMIAENPGGARLAETLEVDQLAWCTQVHGRTVLRVDSPGLAGEGDAMITDRRSLALAVRSADCPLILAADLGGRAVGVAHASWRGTVANITSELITALVNEYGVDAADIIACISPSAGPCCYEVGQDVRRAATEGIGPEAEKYFRNFIERDGRMMFDLWSANSDQLISAGVQPESIHIAGCCTICSNDLFPSYRAEGDSAGRFAAMIALR